jgi:arsenate reductase
MTVTIYHNPACGTSRNVLGLIRAVGETPRVIEYLKTPPSHEELEILISRMGISARDLLRRKGTPYDDLKLGDPALTDRQLIAAMMAHPILINRPIVVTPRGVKLCRPSDVALDLLPHGPGAGIVKEGGGPFITDTRIPGSDASLRAALREASLPADDLEEPGRTFFACRSLRGELLGFAGFERFSNDVLIRSLVVSPDARGKGTGGDLLSLLLRRAFDEGARRAWLLTNSAASFFQKAGFKVIPREQAPGAILATRQAAGLCPASAVLLSRTISL